MTLPTAECDLVMKGGITSGVVYPLAAVELSRTHRFRRIGGASAGAIAAALTAAAELGRQGRNPASFQRLAEEASRLGSRLRSLFQPAPAMRPLFDVLSAAIARGAGRERLARVIAAAACAYPQRTLGVAAGLATLGVALWCWDPPAALIAAGLGLLVALPLAWVHALARDLLATLPRQGFGLCPGPQQDDRTAPALLDWLADLLDELAGSRGDEGGPPRRPLTCGDLAAAGIELRTMTTCLTAGRPYSLPFDNRLFHFRVDEMRAILPARIVDWLADPAVQQRTLDRSSDREEAAAAAAQGFLRMPLPQDMPVVLAVRMSLSFPLLFTAVPLHARDFTLVDEQAQRQLRPAWFSDGGLCRNFPIHLFDSLLPTRPTFGITLDPFDPAAGDERVFFPTRAGDGILRTFRDIGSLPTFVGSLIDTMQEWQDNLQSTLPGFRDRIAHVRLDAGEGGMNLDMDEKVIGRLVDYGKEVGTKLAGFDLASHRWLRTLSAVEQLELALRHAPEMRKVIAGHGHGKPPKEATKEWCDAADVVLAAWGSAPVAELATVADGSFPHPTPVMRIVPRE